MEALTLRASELDRSLLQRGQSPPLVTAMMNFGAHVEHWLKPRGEIVETDQKSHFYIAVVKLLLQAGAIVRNVPVDASRGEATPLNVAISIGSLELVELFVNAGADVNRDQPIYTALHKLAGDEVAKRTEWRQEELKRLAVSGQLVELEAKALAHELPAVHQRRLIALRTELGELESLMTSQKEDKNNTDSLEAIAMVLMGTDDRGEHPASIS